LGRSPARPDRMPDTDTLAPPRPLAEAPPPGGDGGSVRLCVIDLGTNSFHAIVVEAFPDGTFETVEKRKEMVKLGEGGMVSLRLTERAQARGLQALADIRAWAEGLGVSEFVARATSAVRESENGGAFIERVRAETALHVRVITGEEEARLIYEAVRQAVDVSEPTLFVDIGGGSTECIVADRDGAHFLASLKLGAARLTEQFVTTDPVSREEFRILRDHIRQELQPVLAAARAHGVERVVGSSGTIEAIATASAASYGEPDRIHDYVFGVPGLRRVTKTLMTADRHQRLATPGIGAKRVDQVPAGAALLDVILKDLAIKRFEVSPAALREGIVIDYLARNYQWLRRLAPYGSVRRRSVYALAMRLGWDEGHVRQGARLALRLFDAARPLHDLGEAERELLEYAAVLRDVGYAISRRGHHRHSYYVIRNADLRGFSPAEVAVVAHVARLHRAGRPSGRHPDFAKQPEARQRTIVQLAALLRLANGLDRSHFQNVVHLDAGLDGGSFVVTVQTKSDPQLDLWAARRGADLFEEAFGVPVEVRAEE
jgi:exopolyphosphatase / guanosine-5'-triphosphate,3'-diphosphate pyrophosphatase